MDYKHGKRWPLDEIRQYSGLLSYYKIIEKEYFENLIEHFNEKFKVDVKQIIKQLVSI